MSTHGYFFRKPPLIKNVPTPAPPQGLPNSFAYLPPLQNTNRVLFTRGRIQSLYKSVKDEPDDGWLSENYRKLPLSALKLLQSMKDFYQNSF